MSEQLEFIDSVTVSERGAIVIPAKLRKRRDIRAGCRLLVFSDEGRHALVIMKVGQGFKYLVDEPSTE